MPPTETIPNKKVAQRRSQRLLLRVQVVAERPQEKGQAKNEDTETLAVNAHGALILLSPPVDENEQISLKNKKTGETQPCRVVYLGQTESGRMQVGVEFTKPSPQFWRIVFPPEDWGSFGKEVRAPTKI
ncbi:MAG TPA: PilZ domain-containing protein [Candidatus Acidoferrum sp.]|nr:PilZ domain-containing protein [Candidatus Acidoferrum sp.]